MKISNSNTDVEERYEEQQDFGTKKMRKRGVDSLSTGLSNRGLAFVFTRSAMGGGGT
ncbi:MAG: hypothetical protein JWM83_1480 [Candidatus Angelobacter sp.]|nr:hypothetical protein [Candidatus Angelobacter sp.]